MQNQTNTSVETTNNNETEYFDLTSELREQLVEISEYMRIHVNKKSRVSLNKALFFNAYFTTDMSTTLGSFEYMIERLKEKGFALIGFSVNEVPNPNAEYYIKERWNRRREWGLTFTHSHNKGG